MKTKTVLAALGIVAGLEIGLENLGSIKRDCEVYQGYTQSDSDISVQYVFDPEKAYGRAGSPRYALEGNPALKDSLRMGERYCFAFRQPVAPWASRKLKSVDLENQLGLTGR